MGNVKVNGGQIKLIRPETTGGWARGLMFYKDNASARWAGVGMFGSSDNASSLYMAHGESPWSSGNGIYVKTNGNVGIGTITPDAKLEVAGNVIIKNKLWIKQDIWVQTTTPWGDYVFDNDYKLMPLNKLERFIIKNKHLPDVPSAKEIEEKGLNLAETDAIKMVKIEELTLYIIEQNKRIENLEKQINKLLKQ